MQITCWKLYKGNYKALENIICETWKYKSFWWPAIANKMSQLYPASCLDNETFTCVAVDKDMPVGVIMGARTKF